jgi:hypothetical protein
MNIQRMQDIFAEELERYGHAELVLAGRVRDGSDNSHGGGAAIAAMRRVAMEVAAGMPQPDRDF